MTTVANHAQTVDRIGPARGVTAIAEVLLVLPFLAFYLFQLMHHQMWRDELNAWGIAAASPNLKVLYQYVRYEGHPGLWYLILWALSRLTNSPVAMQIFQGFVGVAIYLTIALRTPFSKIEKLLLYASYFVSFEYTVMSRMYGVCLLLTLVYVYRRLKHCEQLGTNAVLLALIANTDITGLILSGALLIEYLWSAMIQRSAIESRGLLKLLGIYGLGVLTCGLALRISPHISWRTTGRMFTYASDPEHLLQAAISYIAVPWFPINGSFPTHFWDPWMGPAFQHRWIIAATPVVIAVMVMIFRKNVRLLAIWGLAAAGAIMFAHLVYMGSARHQGITFIAFLAAYWMLRYRSTRIPVLALILLGANVTAGVMAAVGQMDHPFSYGGAAARWLEANHFDQLPLVGTPDTSVIGVAEQMRRPIYMLDCNCQNTFLLFNIQRDDFAAEQTPDRLKLAAAKLHASDMILLLTYPLPPERAEGIRQQGFSVELLKQFVGAEDYEENYFIYRVRRTSGA